MRRANYAPGLARRAGERARRSPMAFQAGIRLLMARLGYGAFQSHRRMIVAGAGNALMAGSVPLLPRALVLRIARQVLSSG